MTLLTTNQASAIKYASRSHLSESEQKLFATIINLMSNCKTPEEVFEKYGKHINYNTAVKLGEIALYVCKNLTLGKKISAVIKRMAVDPTIEAEINSENGYITKLLPDYDIKLQKLDAGTLKIAIVRQDQNVWLISDSGRIHYEKNGFKIVKDYSEMGDALNALFAAYGRLCDIEIVPLKVRLVKLIVE